MKKTLALLLFAILTQYCFSIDIKGKITDTEHKPIRYANIIIENTSMGIISNEDGVFELKIPEKYTSRHIVISCMGFKTKKIKITELRTEKLHKIALDYNVVNLKEISVKAKAFNTNEVVQQAFDRYYENFPTEPFIAKGFLRHTEKTKTSYKWLVEAAIEMYDPGVDKAGNTIKVNINEVRKSVDNRKIDTLDLYQFYLDMAKGLSFKKYKSIKLSDASREEIQKAIIFHDDWMSNPINLFDNILRRYKQKGAIFNKGIVKKHNFKLDTVLSYNNKNVYKIKITPQSPPVKLNRQNGTYVLPFGWIYIRADDYAIMELNYTLIYSNKGKLFSDIKGSRIASSINIKFIEINKQMYPTYIISKKPKVNNFMKIAINMGKNKEEDPEDFYFSTQEVVFTEIITDKEKIKQRLGEKWNDNLFEPRPYNKVFWENYNILLESKNQKKMINDLEKEVKLKKQFMKNK